MCAFQGFTASYGGKKTSFVQVLGVTGHYIRNAEPWETDVTRQGATAVRFNAAAALHRGYRAGFSTAEAQAPRGCGAIAAR